MEALVAIVAALALVAVGIPLGFSLLSGVILGMLFYSPTDLPGLPSLAMSQVDDINLLAIPLLIIAGELMTAADVVDPILRIAEHAIGRIRGGLALVTVGAGIFFAGSTGSSAAESATLAAALHGPMGERGYSREYTASLIAASAALGVLFPPSFALILYATIVDQPVTQLWLAGIVPGLLAGVLVAVLAFVLARRQPLRRAAPPRPSARPGGSVVLGAETAVVAFIPVLVVGGIYSGLLTIAEIAPIVVAYVALTGLVFRKLTPRELLAALRAGGRRAGAVFIIIVAAKLLSFVLTDAQVIPSVISWVQGLGLGKFVLLLFINLALLALGIFVDNLTIIIVAAPILSMVLQPLGVSPLQLGIIMAMNVEIGVIHPPFGMNLFAVSSATGVSVGRIAIGELPYIGVLLAVLALITYVPLPIFKWA